MPFCFTAFSLKRWGLQLPHPCPVDITGEWARETKPVNVASEGEFSYDFLSIYILLGNFWTKKLKSFLLPKVQTLYLKGSFSTFLKAADQSVALCREHNALHSCPNAVCGMLWQQQQQHGWVQAGASRWAARHAALLPWTSSSRLLSGQAAFRVA